MNEMEPSNDSIPDFIKLQQIPVNYIQQVETDLLEPVVFNQGTATGDGFARFTLQNKGFLHSHSKVFVSLQPEAGVNAGFTAPHVGIGQVIQKAVLKIGNKVLNELDSWAGLHAVKSSLISEEVNKEREAYTTGRWSSRKFQYNADTSADRDVNASAISLDTSIEQDDGNDIEVPNWSKHDTDAKAECPVYQIDLSDLFPFLKVNQLPLYMINEPINIELHFQPTQKLRLQIPSGDTTETTINIDRTELKFCADYIFYGASDQMERYAAANQDLSFSFVDYRVIERSVTSAQLNSGIIQNLGMANRMVSRVISLFPRSRDTYNEATLLGQYVSVAPTLNASGNYSEPTKYNIRYNDRFEFTSDIDNVARLFSTFTESEGVPHLCRKDFSDEGIAGGYTSEITLSTRNQATELEGKQFYLGTRLTNGRVGQRGLELHIEGGWSGGEVDLVRVYCEYMRVARLTGGFIEIFNA
jgi:hypothetical protein